MTIILRMIFGLIGSVLGSIVIIIMDILLSSDGFQYSSISDFLTTVSIGGGVGLIIGFVFYKKLSKLLGFLTRFSVEL